MAIGLESVKKTLQVAGVGTGAIRIGCNSPGTTWLAKFEAAQGKPGFGGFLFNSDRRHQPDFGL